LIPLTTIVFLVPPSDATDLCWTTGRAVPGFGSAADNRGVVASLGVTSRRDVGVIQHKIAATKDAILAPIANLADEANVQLYVLHMSEPNATKVDASETLARNRIVDKYLDHHSIKGHTTHTNCCKQPETSGKDSKNTKCNRSFPWRIEESACCRV
jgi:hypothetical protein